MDEKRMGAQKTASKPKRASRVGEIEALRGRNSKVFRMSDGAEQAVFRADGAENPFELTEDGKHYRSQADGFHAEFSREETSDELFSVKANQHRITVCSGQGKKKRPKLQGKTLRLEDAAEGVDVEYSPAVDGVKETILIKQKAASYRYPFIIRGENISPITSEGKKQISFVSKETGEEVFLIPAPFMVDAAGNISASVNYELEALADDAYCITVVPNAQWLNAEERVFPVTVDPQVVISSSSGISTYSWADGVMTAPADHVIGSVAVEGGYSTNRMYLHFNIPTLPRNPRIQKAELVFSQKFGSLNGQVAPKLALYQITEDITTGEVTPAQSIRLTDYEVVKTPDAEGEAITYTFDVTRLLDAAINGDSTYQNMMLELMDTADGDNITLYGSSNAENTPSICVTYKSSYGVNTSHRANTHELGRFGQGSVDLITGNLTLECPDFAWAGNRMPVTLKHLYTHALSAYQYTANSAIELETADFSAMKLGFGWRLNIMQSMVASSFQHEGEMHDGYVYIGENGDAVYFKQNADDSNLFEAVTDSNLVYNVTNRTLTQGDELYLFDEAGRLIQIKTNLQEEQPSDITITYVAGLITTVTDGIGRSFDFRYNTDGQLTSIVAPDGSRNYYRYIDNILSEIIHPNQSRIAFGWADNKLTGVGVYGENLAQLYTNWYTFSGDRIARIDERGADNSQGALSNFTYSVAARTTCMSTSELADSSMSDAAARTIQTVYTYDDAGNIINEYVYAQDLNKVGSSGSGEGINPYSENGIPTVSASRNLLGKFSLEENSGWEMINGDAEGATISEREEQDLAKFGLSYMCITRGELTTVPVGVQKSVTLAAGEYVCSAYLRPLSVMADDSARGAFLRVTDSEGNVLGMSEPLSGYNMRYMRVIAPFTLTEQKEVYVQIVLDNMGTIYADAVQLEAGSTVTPYNLLQESGFNSATTVWTLSEGASYSSDVYFHSGNSLMLSGSLDGECNANQRVDVRINRSIRETYSLSGWAKACAIPDRLREGADNPHFRLRAVIYYNDDVYEDTSSETFTADFSPATEDWQYASIQFAKSKYREVDHIRVYCDYDYNHGVAYFDDLQLVRDSVETELEPSDFAGEMYDEAFYDGADEPAEVQQNYDSAPEFEERKDEYGNPLTETTYTDGEFGTIYRSFGYSDDGNDLIRETDARGNTTTYTVDPDTSRTTMVTDRCGNKTCYEYDTSGRTTKVTSKDTGGTELANVSYGYDSMGNMTEIVRGDGLKYALQYNAFHKLESIGVDGRTNPLVSYAYRNGNGSLKQVSYANGDYMQITYNSQGQVIAEKWYDINDDLIAHYRYAYDHNGNIVCSIDIVGKKEYSYIYDEGRITRAVECNVEFHESGAIISKNLVHTLQYIYDKDGTLIRKNSMPASDEPASDVPEVFLFENGEDGNIVLNVQNGDYFYTSHSKTDTFGRKEFDEVQNGHTAVSRQFLYYAGEATQEHLDGGCLKSAPTTNLVRQIILSDGSKLSYEYDNEDRITKVTETDATGAATVTQYTYDALGQLTEERILGETEADDVVVNAMTYDNYGNILTKNGKAYVYGDSTWKDLLTSYDGQAITYDAQGNPTTYLGHTLTWEKGRQLKSFDNITYTYNANGIRTSKKVGDVTHSYMLDGTKILRETRKLARGGDVLTTNILVPLYDNEDSICGILYDDTPYYFLKNLQGDIIAITDHYGKVLARYRYDAWGVCTITLDESETGIATINPFRYRGYYFDIEIGMYYLQSRYYNPLVGRFINADDSNIVYRFKGALEALNPFFYCSCNPVNNEDETGRWRLPKLVATGIQVEVSASIISLGFEIIFANGNIYFFTYGGFAYGKTFDDLMNWLKTALTCSFSARSIKKTLKRFISGSASICVFAVFNSISSSFPPNGYIKSFVGFSVTIPTIYGVGIKSYVSSWDVLTSVGVGFCYPSSFDYGGSWTYYTYRGTINLSSAIKNFVNKETKGLKP